MSGTRVSAVALGTFLVVTSLVHAQEATPQQGGTGEAPKEGQQGGTQTPPPKKKAAEGDPQFGGGAPVLKLTRRPGTEIFSFGPHIGQPAGLQLRFRLFELGMLNLTTTHSLVPMVGYDFFYGGLTFSLDYRVDFFTWEFITQDADVSLWFGVGGRVSVLEPTRLTKRELPVALGGRLPVGLTLELHPLPVEASAYLSPIGFDMNSLNFPRWRPELGLELRVRFPYAWPPAP